MTFKLLTEQHLEFLRLTGGCTGLSESTLVKLPHLLEITYRGSLLISAVTIFGESSHMRCHSSSMRTQLPSDVRCLRFDMALHIWINIVCVSSECSGEACVCVSSPEPSLLTYAISTKFH